MEKEQFKKIVNSKKIEYILVTLGFIAVVIFVFHIGEDFGYRRAEITSHSMGNNHNRGFLSDDQTNTHGVVGNVASIINNKLLVVDDDGTEKTVLISTSTIIRKQHDTITPDVIKVDDSVIVIGQPNTNNEIEAKIIRVK